MLLGRNVVEGGSVIIKVIFKDVAGQYYIPAADSVKFTLYAKHSADSLWDIVNGRKDFILPSQSVVDILLQGQDLALLGNCTTKRRVLVEWEYQRNGEDTIGRDMVDFEIESVPVTA